MVGDIGPATVLYVKMKGNEANPRRKSCTRGRPRAVRPASFLCSLICFGSTLCSQFVPPLSSSDHQNLVDIFTSNIFFSPTELLIPPGPAPTPVSLFAGGEGQCHSGSRSCHHLSLCPYLSPMRSGPGLLLCRGVPKRHGGERSSGCVGNS